MRTLRQIVAVCGLNFRNLPERAGSSFVIVIGITGVVAVLISVLALSTGFRRTIGNSAREDRVIVLSEGAESEGASTLPRSAIATILDAPGIGKNAEGRAIGSAETLIIAPVARKSDGLDAYVTLRGVGPRAAELRSEIRIVAGRWFQPAVREVIVGRAAQSRFAGLDIGNRITLRGGEWTVVGTFESDGNSHESGLLADAETVLAAYKLNYFASATVRLASTDSYTQLKDALTANPTLNVQVKRELEYVATVSQPLHRLIDLVAYTIGGIMAVGALFAALNTMYSAVSARTNEIATLRALGFGSGAVVASVLTEALALATTGAVFGAALAYLLFNGHTINTIGGTAGGSQLIYQLTVTPWLVFLGMSLAILLGFLGGLFPAIRVARMPIAAALRAG
jgi:putative ABC transport system permease protein